ncbi:flagellar biosynthesis protein FlhF [Chitinimonas prasina]|uniref:Flagellar biosynthesis protein FlhF n=1 Tax=Chitinimonas prasina TaxID=1434937 RepID=A0ABQ5YJL1_9NEIS|nr:DUF2062 domain-containing protein [Chitinimonas prasina]GLR15200.1 flagellar biosynthesis protein FlhF [Chitinimonas prasina]
MPRKLLRRWLPDRDTLNRNAFLRRCAPFLTHHNLWHLNRHSVSGGLAVGLACGMIPGPLQMLTATVLSILFRVNLPVAIFGTFFSNPFTIVPLYLAAFGLGRLITGANGGPAHIPPAPETDWSNLAGTVQAWLDWMVTLGTPLAIGIVVLALLLALAGYGAVQLGWRLHVRHALHCRRQRRATAGL